MKKLHKGVLCAVVALCALQVLCSASVSVRPAKSLSTSSGGSVHRLTSAEEGDEVIFYTDEAPKDLEAYQSGSTPNVVAGIQTVSAQGVDNLYVQSDLCGVILVPVTGTSYQLDYVGVADKAQIDVVAEVAGDKLSVTVQGARGQRYVSTVDSNLVNVVRIGVPASAKTIQVDDTTSLFKAEEMRLPLEAKTVNGVIRVRGDKLDYPNNLSCVNGSVTVQGETVSGDVVLNAVNGRVELSGGQVSGKVEMGVINGRVQVTVGSLGSAALSAQNGSVHTRVGTISGQVSATATNGKIEVTLTEEPKDLTFSIESARNGKVVSPAGWGKTKTIGNGTASLNIKVSNGKASCSLDY